MRDFFLQQLNSLDKMTGLQQLNKLMAMDDPKKEINDLLDILCRVCKQFNYIPEEDMKRIISESILSDQELTSLNGKIIFKWLSKACGQYYKEAIDPVKLPDGVDEYVPLTGEDRQKKLDEWLRSLKKLDETVKVEFNGAKMKANLAELPQLEGYHKPNAEAILLHDLHIEYLKENYDPITRQRKANWVSENEWLKMQS